MVRILKKKDPVCGMKEEKGKGIYEDDKWFCSGSCLEKYRNNNGKNNSKHWGCCC